MRTTLLLFLFLPLMAFTQVTDDFSDGNFTANPTWIGTDTSFIVNANLQLQSAATTAGEAWLSFVFRRYDKAPQEDPFDMEWRFWIRENFSPSANNYADVWLAADTSDLSCADGFFLRFGSAGNQDAIELYWKEGGTESLICKGTDAAIASAFKVAVKVNRDAKGHWVLAVDFDNTGNYVVEAEGTDDHDLLEGYFGFYLKFTASNGKKFYFDDVYIGPKIIDTESPALLDLEVIDAHRLLLTFSEPLDASALDPQHYHVSLHRIPDTVSFEGHPSKVLLSFTESLPENTNLQLQINDIVDLTGNAMPETVWDFSVYKAMENDVVINEIMADPTPVVGLPEREYIELFNTTGFTINLKNWSLAIGTTTKTIPATSIGPQGFLILCKDDATEELSVYGPTVGFSSFSIANAGATLRLFASDTTLVSEVSFSDTWYHDADKKNGGWSLEQIDPFNPCAGTANWSASVDVAGGTPGRENSINALNEITPTVARVSMLGDDMVLLWFDQFMDRASLADPSRYLVEELDINPMEVICNPIDASSVEVLFDVHFQEGEIYTLLLNGMESCSGHPIEADTRVHFGIPNTIAAGDILINEILFDPISPGVDYVELFNHSDKTFDLSELKLGVIKESFPNPTDTTLKAITQDSRLFLPQSYLLLSTDAYTVGEQYACQITDYVDMESFPSYPNSGGVALLMSRHGVVVDQMAFSEKMHYPLLKETKGVSLERVSFDAPSEQLDNWHSAAEAVHFGTPGYQNSMTSLHPDHQELNPITVEPSVFSPDGDGIDDNCLICFELDNPENTLNAYLFNTEGQLIRHLVKGELVGQEGGFVWNGLDSRGNRVPLGVYVVVTEVFNMDGMVKKYKNAIVVASR